MFSKNRTFEELQQLYKEEQARVIALDRKTARLTTELEEAKGLHLSDAQTLQERVKARQEQVKALQDTLDGLEGTSQVKDNTIKELQMALDKGDRPRGSGGDKKTEGLEAKIKLLETQLSNANSELKHSNSERMRLQEYNLALQRNFQTLRAESANHVEVERARAERIDELLHSLNQEINSEASSLVKLGKACALGKRRFGDTVSDSLSLAEDARPQSSSSWSIPPPTSMAASSKTGNGFQQTKAQPKPTPKDAPAKKDTSEYMANQGFMTPAKSKSATATRGPKGEPFEAIAASRNAFAALAENEKPDPQPPRQAQESTNSRQSSPSQPIGKPEQKADSVSRPSNETKSQNAAPPMNAPAPSSASAADVLAKVGTQANRPAPTTAPSPKSSLGKSTAQVAALPPPAISSAVQLMLDKALQKMQTTPVKSSIPDKMKMASTVLGTVVEPAKPKTKPDPQPIAHGTSGNSTPVKAKGHQPTAKPLEGLDLQSASSEVAGGAKQTSMQELDKDLGPMPPKWSDLDVPEAHTPSQGDQAPLEKSTGAEHPTDKGDEALPQASDSTSPAPATESIDQAAPKEATVARDSPAMVHVDPQSDPVRTDVTKEEMLPYVDKDTASVPLSKLAEVNANMQVFAAIVDPAQDADAKNEDKQNPPGKEASGKAEHEAKEQSASVPDGQGEGASSADPKEGETVPPTAAASRSSQPPLQPHTTIHGKKDFEEEELSKAHPRGGGRPRGGKKKGKSDKK